MIGQAKPKSARSVPVGGRQVLMPEVREESSASAAWLAEKYRAMARLALRREQLEASGLNRFEPRESGARRRAFRNLARAFPGALRELESTPAQVLQARHEAVKESLHLQAGAALPLWMEMAIAYHSELREALAIKRWLSRHVAREAALDAERLGAFRAWYARQPGRLRAAEDFSLEALGRHLRPPDGRLQTAVWELLEARFERPRAEIERLIFGSAWP
jgi:hypothetical protein